MRTNELNTELKVQSWLDGELPEAEAASVRSLVSQGGEAGRIESEWRRTRSLLEAGELLRPVPESRAFYWSGVARGLESWERRRESEESTEDSWWRRLLIPAGVLAAFALLLEFVVTRETTSPPAGVVLAVGHDIETPVEAVASFTFRSESRGMTVVWVADSLN